jgi:predicted GNAT family N-acyltransferase
MEFKPVRDAAEWALVKQIRQRVFVEEQACPPEEEWDAYDEASRHFLGLAGGVPAATARWRTTVHDAEIVAKLERFAVLPAYRGRGHGRALVGYVMDDARRAGFRTFLLHAQAHLAAFYASLGFEPFGAPFEEAGIPHVRMIRRDPA